MINETGIAIKVTNLSKIYPIYDKPIDMVKEMFTGKKKHKEYHALQNISFELKKGEVVGFLGRNGAGKTTTMNIITGYISSSEGSASVDGHDILVEPIAVKKKIGYLPEQPPVYMDMVVDEYLNFCCDIKKVGKDKRKGHLNDVCDLVGISHMRKRLCKNLSKGYKQRVGLAQALVGNPEVDFVNTFVDSGI